MQIGSEPVSEKRYTIDLTETEVIHLEAAMDCLTDADDDSAKNYLGMFDGRWDSRLACRMLEELRDVRGDIINE